ncbi:hypothetical protein [Mycobacterium sp. 1423905.2]|uniref:hypothetical protein n=1 Tax=Mycobacterium sp. 1423905.2 TaxID=1856859 RepID=UPI0007FC4892|nr:hypothetical protein [Mycobacterium sp. 1423905.2]OBJ49541.1 hypothetical protein A9W95_25590 [Mycobacterium sp. 1423905.2]
MALGWWPEVRRTFTLSLFPTLVAHGVRSAKASLTLTPVIGMGAGSHMHAGLNLSLTPAFGFVRRAYPGAAGLSLAPAIGMMARPRYARTASLSLSPTITMSGINRAAFTLALTPSIGMVGAVHNTQFPYTFPFNLA